MKFLFLLDTVDFPLAPNPVLARRVAASLAERGHSVHLLELWDGETPPPAAKGCRAHPLAFAEESRMNRILEFGHAGGTPVPLRLAKLALHPSAALAAVRQFALKSPRRISDTRKAIERLNAQEHFDAVIAVAAPFSSSFALADAAIPAKKVSWQMDPYAANRSYTAPGLWEKEKQLCARMDALLVAPAMAENYAPTAPLSEFSGRMQVLDFPGLVPLPPLPSAPSGSRLRCVFVGSLYPELRTPHYALELFAALNDPGLELVFVGGGWENYPADLLRPYQELLGNRLTVTGPLPKAQADEWLGRADVLLSLGNGVNNQVPSKLFEYFAAGKPILHLAKLADDPCLAYFRRWPAAYCLTEQQGCGPAVCAALRDFFRDHGRDRLPFSQAEQVFAENTPDFAADCFERLFTIRKDQQ